MSIWARRSAARYLSISALLASDPVTRNPIMNVPPGKGRSGMSQPPSTRVLPHELPASLRDAGLDHWIREPLDDAVDRRRRIIMPPAVALLGTPASGYQGALLAEAKHADTVFMMGDNPALPTMSERPSLRDFY